MYKGLWGKDHKLIQVNLNNLQKNKTTRTGLFDKNILCAECDNHLLGKLETYVSTAIYNLGNSNIRKQIITEDIVGKDGFRSIRYHNLDYSKVKLFFLSILWRSHISSLPFFEPVQLGIYAERIRKMLLNNDPGEEDSLETTIIKFEDDNTRFYKALIDFRHLKIDNNSWYVFSMDSMMYHFNLSSYNKQSIFTKGLVRKDGTMDIALMGGEYARDYFDSFLGRKMPLKSNKA